MKLMADPDAKPVTHHTPVPVSLHWRDAIEAGLDQDVRLGVIEPAPVGEPVTWCHKMVVCAKKIDTPRRTVDFQLMVAHATRETHNTPTPFHQALPVPHDKRKTIFVAWDCYRSVPIYKEDIYYSLRAGFAILAPWLHCIG